MGFRVFVSPLQPSKAFLPSKGTRAGAAGGGRVCALPRRNYNPQSAWRGAAGGRQGREARCLLGVVVPRPLPGCGAEGSFPSTCLCRGRQR